MLAPVSCVHRIHADKAMTCYHDRATLAFFRYVPSMTQIMTIMRPSTLAALACMAASLWVLQGYLVTIGWSVIIVFATWPLYEKLQRTACGICQPVLPMLMTLMVTLLLLVPATFSGVMLAHEIKILARLLTQIQVTGIPQPDWVREVPGLGAWAAESWSDTLGNPELVKNALNDLGFGTLLDMTTRLAERVLHHVLSGFIILLSLYFLYRDGRALGLQMVSRCDSLFGDAGGRYARHAMTAVRATVNGMLLVGMGKGVILGIGYVFVGLPQPVLLGALTAVVALVPFAAKLVFGAASLYLITDGHASAGVGLLIYGFIITFIADNYVRPYLIGGAVRIPFLLTLLGIFGGVESMGLIGLFLGPTLMAVLISFWRDWNEQEMPSGNGV